MKLDIILITYNQEQYIAQAVESILMQRVDDDVQVRVIVADDCSKDKTLEIIKSYEVKSPFPFVYLPIEDNMGHVRNYQRAFTACVGDYVAILEGDDWWSSPIHLQIHIDFLDVHRECVLTTQHPIWYFENEQYYSPTSTSNFNINNYKYVTLEEELTVNRIVNLSSCLIRTEAIHCLDEQIFGCTVLDWPMYVNLSQLGLLCVLSGSSNVYRAKSSGLYAGLDNVAEKKVDEILINEIENIFPQYACYCRNARNIIYPKSKTMIRKTIEFLLRPLVYIGNKYRQICVIYNNLKQ